MYQVARYRQDVKKVRQSEIERKVFAPHSVNFRREKEETLEAKLDNIRKPRDKQKC